MMPTLKLTLTHVSIILFSLRLTAQDIGVAVLLEPSSGCNLGASETVTVNIRNYSGNSAVNFEVSYRINGGTPVVETIPIILSPGDSLDYSFTAKADLSSVGSYDFTIVTLLAGDTVATNDVFPTTVISSTEGLLNDGITMGFDNDEDRTGWEVEDVNGDGWAWLQFGVNPIFILHGNGAALYLNSDVGTADDWLFTKCYSLEASKTYVVSFYYNSFSSERFEVKIGQDQNAAGMIQTIHDFSVLPASGTRCYKTHTSEFTVGADGTYYLGFHLYTTGGSNAFLLDDIEIRELKDHDLQLKSVDNFNYTMIPIKQLFPVFDVTLSNLGQNTLTGVDVTMSVEKGFTEIFTTSSQGVSSLGSGIENTVTTTQAFFPLVAGNYNFKFEVNLNESDENPSNNILEKQVVISESTYALDNGVPAGSLNLDLTAVGQVFKFTANDSITAISTFLVDDLNGVSISFTVYQWTGTTAGAEVFTTSSFMLNDSQKEKWSTFTFPAEGVGSGEYLVAIKRIGGPTMGVGFDGNKDGFIATKFGAASWQTPCGYGTPLIRVHTGAPGVSILEATFTYEHLAATGQVTFIGNSTLPPHLWLWDFGDNKGDSIQFPVHTYVQSQTYNVCLTIAKPLGSHTYCEAVAVDWTILDHAGEDMVDQIFTLYPNPVDDNLLLNFEKQLSSDAVVLVYNMFGKKVLSRKISQGNNSVSLDVSGIPDGIYFIGTRFGDSMTTSKLVISH